MKGIFSFFSLALVMLAFSSCTKTESDFSEPETISINASSLTAVVGTPITFRVLSSVNSADVTTSSKIFVNGTEISGSTYTFTSPGTYAVYGTKASVTSNILSITVVNSVSGYRHNVLVEDYSGNWCGNCPRILYGVDLLYQQTQKAFTVGIHLFGGDPFITTQGNDLAALRGVTGVPTGHINRTINWTGPQYQNVTQVINEIKPSAQTGIAINSTVGGNTLNATIKTAYQTTLSSAAKLTVYLVQDGLSASQRNYSSNLYSGQSTIPNFVYKDVLRAVVSGLSGDDIANTGIAEKTYSLTVPSTITNIANAYIIAFVTDASGNVINVQRAKVGVNVDFERL